MNWFCLYTSIAGEFRALAGLQARRFHVYLPLATRVRTLRGQRLEHRTPLLSRYLFINLLDFNRLCDIKAIAAVQEILPHEHEPVTIPGSEIERLWEREQAGEFVFRSTATDRKRRHKILRSLAELAMINEEGYFCVN